MEATREWNQLPIFKPSHALNLPKVHTKEGPAQMSETHPLNFLHFCYFEIRELGYFRGRLL